MRILLLTNKSPWPPKDGGSAATLKTIYGLSACNCNITVLAVNTSKHFADIKDIPGKLQSQVEFHFVNIRTGINYFKLILNLLFSRKPYNLERFSSRNLDTELKSLLKNNFDIIQIEGLAMYHYLPVIRKNSSTPIFFRPHNIENKIWSQLAHEERNILKKTYFRILAKRIKRIEIDIINKPDAVVPISDTDLAWFKKEGLKLPSIVYTPGYFTEEICDYSESASHSVFFIGALDWLPNIYGLNWFIKEVWPIVSARIPDAVFFIAGRNPSHKSIIKLRGKNIFFNGEVESSNGFMKDKAVMVVPLFSGSGIRMKIIEGMSMGKSIVATPIAAEGLIFENNSNLFISSEVSGFAIRIIDLLENNLKRKETGENAIENVRKNYNILASSEKLMNFYREFTA
jgi:glycosyltransferase involved in cell wall biosynthesis